MNYDFDLVVVGAGSGGFGAALSASRQGIKVLVVEAASLLGGTSTLGGVNTWEPGICGPGFSRELYDRLAVQPQAIGVSRTTAFYSPQAPWGLSEIDPELPYEQSRRRAGVPAEAWARVTFEPRLLAREMERMLCEAGVQIAYDTRFLWAKTQGERITHLHFSSPKGEWEVRPRLVVDSTAGLHLARAVGCSTRIGAEARSDYNEPSAPDTPRDQINAVSLCFRVERTEAPCVEPLPAGLDAAPVQVPISMTQYPNGDLNMNPLPIMEGMEFIRLVEEQGYGAARRECQNRVLRLFHWLQTKHGFQKWRIKEIFPMVGVREGARLLARNVLTETDVRAGWQKQRDAGSVVALADHALDVHGEGHMCRELSSPYGVPYGCLLPREYTNLAVACRGAGFTHIAAASCRLSRTMMDLGHAAGLASALALRQNTQFPGVEITALRAAMQADGVVLEV